MATTTPSNANASSASSTPAAATPPVVSTKETYKGPNPSNAPIVRLRLLQPDTVQYDTVNKIMLNSSDKKGVLIPLTPFFASRIGTNVELVIGG